MLSEFLPHTGKVSDLWNPHLRDATPDLWNPHLRDATPDCCSRPSPEDRSHVFSKLIEYVHPLYKALTRFSADVSLELSFPAACHYRTSIQSSCLKTSLLFTLRAAISSCNQERLSQELECFCAFDSAVLSIQSFMTQLGQLFGVSSFTFLDVWLGNRQVPNDSENHCAGPRVY